MTPTAFPPEPVRLPASLVGPESCVPDQPEIPVDQTAPRPLRALLPAVITHSPQEVGDVKLWPLRRTFTRNAGAIRVAGNRRP